VGAEPVSSDDVVRRADEVVGDASALEFFRIIAEDWEGLSVSDDASCDEIADQIHRHLEERRTS
jgi:predicted secreted Zn-dependent protease